MSIRGDTARKLFNINCPDIDPARFERAKKFWLPKADIVLSPIKKELEEMENPHKGTWIFLDKNKAEIKRLEADSYEQCRKDAIALLGGKE